MPRPHHTPEAVTVGGYSLNLAFGFTVHDTDRWTPESLAAAERDTDAVSYDDWAAARLRDVMEAAGQQYMAAHPDVYYPYLV